MKAVVKLFAGAREAVGQSEIEIEIGAPCTIGQLRDLIQAQYPALAPLLSHSLFAIEGEYSEDKAVIPPEAEIACIPPVSGG